MSNRLRASGAGVPRKKGAMDGLIGLIVFAVFAILWIAFGAAIVQSQGSLDEAWQWLGGLPLIFQGVVALLLLPVVIGLWVWETSWPLVARLSGRRRTRRMDGLHVLSQVATWSVGGTSSGLGTESRLGEDK